MTKKDDATKVEATVTEGARKLKLSVTRMKKLRSSVKAGNEDLPRSTANSTLSWASLGNEIDRNADRPLSPTPNLPSDSSNPGGWGGHPQRVIRPPARLLRSEGDGYEEERQHRPDDRTFDRDNHGRSPSSPVSDTHEEAALARPGGRPQRRGRQLKPNELGPVRQPDRPQRRSTSSARANPGLEPIELWRLGGASAASRPSPRAHSTPNPLVKE
jgi:hypothetical protein